MSIIPQPSRYYKDLTCMFFFYLYSVCIHIFIANISYSYSETIQWAAFKQWYQAGNETAIVDSLQLLSQLSYWVSPKIIFFETTLFFSLTANRHVLLCYFYGIAGKQAGISRNGKRSVALMDIGHPIFLH